MKKAKRLLSVLLAFVMIFSMMSTMASAYQKYKDDGLTLYDGADTPVLTTEQERGVLSYLTLYILIILGTFLIVSIGGLGIEEDFTAAVSCVNNIGPGFGLIGPAGSYAVYSGFSKIVLSFAMLIGRLEIYPLLSLLMLGSRR